MGFLGRSAKESPLVRAIAFVTTAWRPRHAGIDAFNSELCCALAAQRDDVRVICVVLSATDADVVDAGRRNVELVAARGESEAFVDAHAFELRELARGWPGLAWWVG